MNSVVEEIKNRLDIVEVIQGYISLQKAGINWKARCPFHSEKTPSFFISPSRQIWHCFGCQKGGDIFKFVMEVEGVEFGDALRTLASRAGVRLEKQDPKLKTERSKHYDICEDACRYFEQNIQKAGPVLDYLFGRGINEKSIKEFRIGWSSPDWHGLKNHLTQVGYNVQDIDKAGLIVKKEDKNIREIGSQIRSSSRYYDRFRERIMFPIFDFNGRVIGFGGRIFQNQISASKNQKNEDVAKYVNTPNTLLYDKSRVLYGLDKARIDIRRQDSCVLVEGYTDVIMSHQAGVKNVIATSGTALTQYQLNILKRYSNNLFTAFDMDIAGGEATKRGIGLAQAMGFNIKVIEMSKDKDPADFIKQDSSSWQNAVKKAKLVMEYFFDKAFSTNNPDEIEGKMNIIKIILPQIKIIPSRIEASHWISKLASRLKVKESDIETELKNIKISENCDIVFIKEDKLIRQNQKPRIEILEEELASLLLFKPDYINLYKKEVKNLNFKTPYFSLLFSDILKTAGPGVVPKEHKDFADSFIFRAETKWSERLDEIENEIKFCIREIKFYNIKQELENIGLEIRNAENERDNIRVVSLSKRFCDLSQRLVELQIQEI